MDLIHGVDFYLEDPEEVVYWTFVQKPQVLTKRKYDMEVLARITGIKKLFWNFKLALWILISDTNKALFKDATKHVGLESGQVNFMFWYEEQ